ncbi:MAG: hypothetical protein K9N09_10745 [Candidatus Cloacimonetes bacterium]|nr:hypothetical protein [Candidatus Cloacimonadota bacterium]MCF7815133.1 hypothetical protein [Candidatus Cloacimonadota bacterium]MCF7869163.1 hypothetical protein [Candidatus Cloacimonadota bacterium]MCF7884601.1 hypothetical protein [Candidatus Cloacimonadota bacterium]
MKKKTAKANKEKFPIVGIGASAGGLEALERFFENMPSDAGIAFVVIQHLDPKHKSIMASLLEKYTKMKIFEVKDGMPVKKNSIYLTPPNKNIEIMNGVFYLLELDKTKVVNLPINHFFKSLSNEQAEKAICIILSGTGSDGTQSLKTIKAAGGMIMVQEEKQAKYDGMPHNAIETGLVDYVLPVEKMPEILLKYIKHPILIKQSKQDYKQQFDKHLNKIFAIIRAQTGHDFSNYKKNTIQRRIERRLAVHQIERISDYLQYLQQTPAEVDILMKEMLITVTNFFRDPESFEV